MNAATSRAWPPGHIYGIEAAAGRAVSRFGKVLESNRKLKILLPEIENKLAEKATASVKC